MLIIKHHRFGREFSSSNVEQVLHKMIMMIGMNEKSGHQPGRV